MRKELLVILLSMMIWAVSTIGDSSAEVPIELEQGGWEMPGITQVDVSLINATGFYQLNFAVEGTSDPGTESIEVTFGGLNGTKIEVAEDMWFSEDTNFQIFNNWILLQGTGNSTDEWSTWTFEINFAISSTNGLMGAIESLSNLPGLNFDLGNFSLEEFDTDATNVTQAIAEMKFYFIARSYNETGSWGQEAQEITGQVQTALLGFLIDEGLVEGPSDDDDQEPPDDDIVNEDEGKETNTVLIIAVSLAGVVFMIAAIGVAVVMVLRRSKKA